MDRKAEARKAETGCVALILLVVLGVPAVFLSVFFLVKNVLRGRILEHPEEIPLWAWVPVGILVLGIVVMLVSRSLRLDRDESLVPPQTRVKITKIWPSPLGPLMMVASVFAFGLLNLTVGRRRDDRPRQERIPELSAARRPGE